MSKTPAKKCVGVALILVPFILWYAYGVHQIGWLIPTFVCAASAAILCGFEMLS